MSQIIPIVANIHGDIIYIESKIFFSLKQQIEEI